MPRCRAVLAVTVTALLAVSACSSGSSSATAKQPTTTTKRKPIATTTTARITSSTAVPNPSSTSVPQVPAPPPAPTGTCGARTSAISAAVQGADLGSVSLSTYTVSDCRVAPSNQIWAAVTLVPNPGAGVAQLTVALQRIGSIWVVQSYAPNRVSCDAPVPVPVELRLGC